MNRFIGGFTGSFRGFLDLVFLRGIKKITKDSDWIADKAVNWIENHEIFYNFNHIIFFKLLLWAIF